MESESKACAVAPRPVYQTLPPRKSWHQAIGWSKPIVPPV